MGGIRQAASVLEAEKTSELVLRRSDVEHLCAATGSIPTAGSHFASTIWQLPRLLSRQFEMDITAIAHTRLRWHFRSVREVELAIRTEATCVDRCRRGSNRFDAYESKVLDADGAWVMSCWDEVVTVTPDLLGHWRRPILEGPTQRTSIRRLREWNIPSLRRSVHNTDFMRSLGFVAPVVESTSILEHALSTIVRRIGQPVTLTFITARFRAPIFEGEPLNVTVHVSESPAGWSFNVDYCGVSSILCACIGGLARVRDPYDENCQERLA